MTTAVRVFSTFPKKGENSLGAQDQKRVRSSPIMCKMRTLLKQNNNPSLLVAVHPSVTARPLQLFTRLARGPLARTDFKVQVVPRLLNA